MERQEALQLIEKAKNGDKKAREELIFAYYKLVGEIAKKYSHRSNYEDVFEAGVEGLLKGINRVIEKDSYDSSKGELSTYLGGAIENRIRLYLKREFRQTRRIESIEKEVIPNIDTLRLKDILPNKGNFVEEICEADETEFWVKKIKKIMKCKLTKQQAEVIELKFLQGGEDNISQEQVGNKLLGITKQRVSQLQKRAIERIKKELKKDKKLKKEELEEQE